MPTSQLPVEILDLAFRQLSPGGLSAVARANKAFCDIAGRILYRSIEDSKPSRSIKILKSLFHRPSNATLVRVLDLDWSYCDFRLTGNFFRLLHNVLKNLTSLTSLSLDFSRSACLHTSFSWILDDCSFSLTFFAISIPCDAQLIHFLQNQPGITELHLRGLESTFPLDQPLPPTCLPNLTSFRSINASASVLAELVNGRPIRGVSISLHESSISECLDALSLSTRPMKTLTLITFDVKMPNLLFAEVSKRMPHLEALHIIVIHSQCTMEDLLASGPLLADFRELRYLTFMATGIPSDRKQADEVAVVWHKSCPALRTIILPPGNLWFSTNSSTEDSTILTNILPI